MPYSTQLLRYISLLVFFFLSGTMKINSTNFPIKFVEVCGMVWKKKYNSYSTFAAFCGCKGNMALYCYFKSRFLGATFVSSFDVYCICGILDLRNNLPRNLQYAYLQNFAPQTNIWHYMAAVSLLPRARLTQTNH